MTFYVRNQRQYVRQLRNVSIDRSGRGDLCRQSYLRNCRDPPCTACFDIPGAGHWILNDHLSEGTCTDRESGRDDGAVRCMKPNTHKIRRAGLERQVDSSGYVKQADALIHSEWNCIARSRAGHGWVEVDMV